MTPCEWKRRKRKNLLEDSAKSELSDLTKRILQRFFWLSVKKEEKKLFEAPLKLKKKGHKSKEEKIDSGQKIVKLLPRIAINSPAEEQLLALEFAINPDWISANSLMEQLLFLFLAYYTKKCKFYY